MNAPNPTFKAQRHKHFGRAKMPKKSGKTPPETKATLSNEQAVRMAANITAEELMAAVETTAPTKCQSAKMGWRMPYIPAFFGRYNQEGRENFAHAITTRFDVGCTSRKADQRAECVRTGNFPCMTNVQQKLQADS